ncbi:MAG: SRPBCC family protein [Gammaproteobacteria bacterium]|nr:SRPBCC family protein [Gammaproteobacteria bacterium]
MLKKVDNQIQPDTLIHNPDTPIIRGTVDLDVPSSAAWEVVGDFGGFDKFITGLQRIEMTGTGVRSIRKKFFADGNIVVEQLNSHVPERMVMTWSLLYTTFNIGNLWASMRVEPCGEHACTVIWDIAGEPWNGDKEAQEDFNAFVSGFLDMAMANLRSMFNK